MPRTVSEGARRQSDASPKEISEREEVAFRGHPMVVAAHPRTIEITTEETLTPRGDCIIGVGAAKGLSELSPSMKAALRREGATARLTILAPGGEFSFLARGSGALSFESATDIVIRKSQFVCGRTLAVQADASALEVPRELVRSLKSHRASGVLRIEVYG